MSEQLARQAEKLLKNSLWRETISEIRLEMANEIVDSPSSNIREREDLYREVRALERLAERIEVYLSDYLLDTRED